MCLNEYHLILLLAGAFVGFSHSLLGVIYNMNYVSFHTVQVCDMSLLSYLTDVHTNTEYLGSIFASMA